MDAADVATAMAGEGFTADQVAAVLCRLKTKSSGAQRQARYRVRKQAMTISKAVTVTDSDVTDVTSVTNVTTVTNDAPVGDLPSRARVLNAIEEDIIERKEELTNVSSKKSPSAKRDPAAILETVLSPEVAAGVVEFRQKLRKPLTAMAADGLAKGFAETGKPDAAARMMVERGWQGFKPEWFASDSEDRPEARAGPTIIHSSNRQSNPEKSVHEAAKKLCEDVASGKVTIGPIPPSIGELLARNREREREDSPRLLPQGRG